MIHDTWLLLCCCCLATQISQRATRSCIRQLISHSGLQGSRQYSSAFLFQAMFFKSYSYRNYTIFFTPSFLDTLINHFCAVPDNLLKYHSLLIVCNQVIFIVIENCLSAWHQSVTTILFINCFYYDQLVVTNSEIFSRAVSNRSSATAT